MTYDQAVGCGIVAALVIFVVWVVWYEVFRHWHCAVCGKVMRGTTDPLTGLRTTSRCGECCGYRRISHAQYLHSFSAVPSLKEVKND